MIGQLPDEVMAIDVKNEMAACWRIPAFLKANGLVGNVHLVSFNPWSLVVAFITRFVFRAMGFPCVRSFYLIPHSRAMFFSGGKLAKLFLRNIFLRAPKQSTYFMNDVTLEAHENEWKRSLAEWPILRLPVGETNSNWQPKNDGVLKIVSVGRIVPFKDYNRAAPDIAASLIRAGLDVCWTIWGHGEDEEIVNKFISERGVKGSVKLMGSLPYSRLEQEIIQHDVFIGMGTALLEASLAGMPTICALENGRGAGYGFMTETPSDSIGDLKAGYATEPLVDTLQRFAAMSADDRKILAQACSKEASARGVSLASFVAALDGAALWPARLRPSDLFYALTGIIALGFRETVFAIKYR